MYLKLKNVDRKFDVTAPTERSASGADKKYWVITFNITERLTTEEIEEYFMPENTAEMTFVTVFPNDIEYEYAVLGYVNKVFSLIKHASDGTCSVEMQFSKEVV